ncbi:MAG: hypothetical protein IH874_03905 [Candidatus Dadabacteria bacterium]|nr:hypothetical protein [Candidatus Dadabacteria bacterium]
MKKLLRRAHVKKPAGRFDKTDWKPAPQSFLYNAESREELVQQDSGR